MSRLLKLIAGVGIAAVCATGCGSATLVDDGGAAAGGNGTGGQGGTAGNAPTGTGGTAGVGGKIATGGVAGGTAGTIGAGGMAGASGCTAAGTQLCNNQCVNVSGTDASNCGSC